MANNKNTEPPLLDSINQAAATLGISRSLLYKQINSGRLKSVKVGKRRLIPRDAQREWLASLPSS
jgi:excisionase family DNA binding protein